MPLPLLPLPPFPILFLGNASGTRASLPALPPPASLPSDSSSVVANSGAQRPLAARHSLFATCFTGAVSMSMALNHLESVGVSSSLACAVRRISAAGQLRSLRGPRPLSDVGILSWPLPMSLSLLPLLRRPPPRLLVSVSLTRVRRLMMGVMFICCTDVNVLGPRVEIDWNAAAAAATSVSTDPLPVLRVPMLNAAR